MHLITEAWGLREERLGGMPALGVLVDLEEQAINVPQDKAKYILEQISQDWGESLQEELAGLSGEDLLYRVKALRNQKRQTM